MKTLCVRIWLRAEDKTYPKLRERLAFGEGTILSEEGLGIT